MSATNSNGSSDSSDNDLSKLDLFIKIMRMTESDNDGQSLVAIRKANSMLKSEKWDWERLLRGKVKVIQDPFAAAQAPMAAPAASAAPMRASPPPRPQQPLHATAAAFAHPAAANPWPAGQRPQARPQAPRPAAPQSAPRGPIHFRRDTRDEWCIAYHTPLDSQIGQTVEVSKKDGSKDKKTVGPFSERSRSGHYLYKMASASKWEKKYADQKVGLSDIF